MPSEKLLPIGAFARACRLGIKALRHYDELGLLRPARVDASGYRYYARAQARDAIAISLLRSLDVPLPAIKSILRSSSMQEALAAERARIEREMARSRIALHCVERIMRDGALMPYEVRVREADGRTVLAVETTTPPELHVEAGYELFARLRRLVEVLGRPLARPIAGLLPEPLDGDTMILQMTTPATAPIDTKEVRAAGGLVVELPSGPFAYVTHRGPYEELGVAHHAITAWVEEHGERATGALVEIYENDPAEVDVRDLVTVVGIPIAG
ncbi:MAG: MerR family transcriptional regulator [Deltaproteobacteria bacterium]|nr:MerR family transcriptional regulator [Deltaproteobacteria bacterium]